MAETAQRVSRVSPVSLPNLLTYARILAIPAMVACFFLTGDVRRWAAVVIFVFAGVTDFFDGYLARAWQQQSSLGRMLDPIADKLLVAAALLILVADGTIGGWSLWAALVILAREILVSGLREYLAEVRISMPVSRLAKWKTAAQMGALGFLLLGPAAASFFPQIVTVGLGLLWLAAILTIYTGYDYLRAGVQHVVKADS